MSQIILSDQAVMSNSIAAFVLRHPEIDNVDDAYNCWVQEEQWKDYPWTDPDTPVFCLHMLDVCMHKIDRETLDEIQYEEERMLLSSL